MSLELVSLTGADDKVSPHALSAMSERYELAEWAILYFPEREGLPRNPSAAWRNEFLALGLEFTAAHLCGQQVFREILDPVMSTVRIADLTRYRRIQLNINARHQDFTRDEVLSVYRALHQAGLRLIFQYHEGSKEVIETFMSELNLDEQINHDILFDCSKGKGVRPSVWRGHLDSCCDYMFYGYAGGLAPDVLEVELPKISAAAQPVRDYPFWIDMETGIRTDNEFDLMKVERVLEISSKFVAVAA